MRVLEEGLAALASNEEAAVLALAIAVVCRKLRRVNFMVQFARFMVAGTR